MAGEGHVCQNAVAAACCQEPSAGCAAPPAWCIRFQTTSRGLHIVHEALGLAVSARCGGACGSGGKRRPAHLSLQKVGEKPNHALSLGLVVHNRHGGRLGGCKGSEGHRHGQPGAAGRRRRPVRRVPGARAGASHTLDREADGDHGNPQAGRGRLGSELNGSPGAKRGATRRQAMICTDLVSAVMWAERGGVGLVLGDRRAGASLAACRPTGFRAAWMRKEHWQ